MRFAIVAASPNEAHTVLRQALARLDEPLPLRGEPVIHPRHRRTRDGIWIAEVQPDLARFHTIDPDDAKTRCRIVQGHFPMHVYWALPANTETEAKCEWPPDIWQRQPGRDDTLLHPAIQAIMIHCGQADSGT